MNKPEPYPGSSPGAVHVTTNSPDPGRAEYRLRSLTASGATVSEVGCTQLLTVIRPPKKEFCTQRINACALQLKSI